MGLKRPAFAAIPPTTPLPPNLPMREAIVFESLQTSCETAQQFELASRDLPDVAGS